jgi:hypothetical protein
VLDAGSNEGFMEQPLLKAALKPTVVKHLQGLAQVVQSGVARDLAVFCCDWAVDSCSPLHH